MTKSVTFKFKKFEDPDMIELAAERIRLVPGVVSVECVFPDTNDSELKRLYVLKVVPSVVDQVLARLKQDPNVDLAYETPERNLATSPDEQGHEESVKSATESYSDQRPYGWDPVRQVFDYDHPDDDD